MPLAFPLINLCLDTILLYEMYLKNDSPTPELEPMASLSSKIVKDNFFAMNSVRQEFLRVLWMTKTGTPPQCLDQQGEWYSKWRETTKKATINSGMEAWTRHSNRPWWKVIFSEAWMCVCAHAPVWSGNVGTKRWTWRTD